MKRVISLALILAMSCSLLAGCSSSSSGIAKFFFGGVAGLCSEPWAEVVTDASYVFVCWLFLYFLYKQKIFLKV